MISSFEVGAVFAIEDRATARLTVIAEGLERIAALAAEATAALARVGVGVKGLANLATRLTRVEAALSGVSAASVRMAGGVDEAMTSISDATMGATGRVAALRAELAGAGIAARGLRGGFGGGGGGRSVREGGSGGGVREGGGRGWLGFGTGGVVARFGTRLTSMPALASGFSIYEAGKMALTERQSLAETLQAMQLPTSGPASEPFYRQMYALMARSAEGTIYTEATTARASVEAAKILGFSGVKGANQFASIFPVILRMAEVGQQYGLGGLNQNILSASMYAHLTGRYSATSLGPGLDKVLALSMHTGMSITSLERTMSQGLPMVKAAGANVDLGGELVGFLARGGLGRRAGYAVGQMLVGLLTTGGPLTAHLAKVKGALIHTLGGNTPHLPGRSKHIQALEDLGLMDPHGQLTVLDKQGNINLRAVMQDIANAKAHMTRANLLQALHAALGVRGLRGAALLDMTNFLAFDKTISGTASSVALQKQLAQQPLQQLQQVWARLKDIANVMATAVLPDFETLTGALLHLVTGIDRFMRVHPMLAKMIVEGAAGYMIGGPLGAAAGITAGANPEGVPLVLPPHHPLLRKWVTHPPTSWDLNKYLPGHSLSSSPIHKQSWLGGGVHIDHLVVNGAPGDADHTWVERIMAAMSDRLHQAAKANLGGGFGWEESPFTQGGGMAI